MKTEIRELTDEEKQAIKSYLKANSIAFSLNSCTSVLKMPKFLIARYVDYLQPKFDVKLGYKNEAYYTEEEMLRGYIPPKFEELKLNKKEL